ncbi:MAG: ribose 5-phosphate isomerase B [Clostridiales bacterium]|jgi:ribose 5-phosphate isomerase B|nr:ribose 5-phosphate isomerase B [Clostridiales bacterium]
MQKKDYNISIACDHAGFELKQAVKQYLSNNFTTVLDFGVQSADCSVDYPDFAKIVCQNVLQKKSDFGILVCGTGIGMSIVANKFRGVRCALCSDTYSAKMTRQHNDSNVLALGAKVVGVGLAIEIVECFLFSQFSNQKRHIDRIAKMENDN